MKSVGLTSRSNTTIAETGLPGSPKTGLPCTTPTMVGFPGLTGMPWTSTPGLPRLLITVAVLSCALTELPAEKTSASDSSRPFTADSRWTS